MTPAAAQALDRIYVATMSSRPNILVDGAVNTDDRVAHSTAVALTRRGLIMVEDDRATITPAGVDVVVASRRRRAAQAVTA
jgi:hypothetical protein